MPTLPACLRGAVTGAWWMLLGSASLLPAQQGPAAVEIHAVADAILAENQRVQALAAEGDGWGENTAATRAARAALEDRWLARLRAVNPAGLERPDRLLLGMLRESLEATAGLRVCQAPLWNVSHFNGWHLSLSSLPASLPVATPDDRARLVRRFAALGRLVDARITDLRAGLAAGYSAPRSNIPRVVEQLDVLLADDSVASPLLAPARRAGDPAFAATWSATLRDHALPAIRRFREFLLVEYQPRAREAIALAALPDGVACYRAQVRAYTSLDLDPADLRAMGRAARAEADSQATVLLARLLPGRTATEARAIVRTDSAFVHRDREEMVAGARAMMEHLHGVLGPWFSRVPPDSLVVEPTPAILERGDAAARYSGPSGGRPGTFYVNTFRPEIRPRMALGNMAAHEGWPGHHLQGAIARARTVAHPIQRQLGAGAFTEGWGMYAERLADEMGGYPSDLDRIGYFLHIAVALQALEVDAGVHTEGWSRAATVDSLLAGTGRTRAEAEQFADRHAATPGQLVTYMVGYLEILRLREQARTALGGRFDIRAFHDQVLEDGPVTLGMLRDKIQRWIASRTDD